MNADYPIARELFAENWRGLGGDEVWLDRVSTTAADVEAASTVVVATSQPLSGLLW